MFFKEIFSRLSSDLPTRVSSQMMISPASKMSRHLAEISPKLPIGVGKKYSKAYCKPYFFLNLSTRPALSTIFSLPVKNGWQAEQISKRISALFERVLKVLPQAQVTLHSTYSGCMSFFIVYPFFEIKVRIL